MKIFNFIISIRKNKISKFNKELEKTRTKINGVIDLFENEFAFHLGVAFYITYNEIFIDKIYEFKTKRISPTIIDCGSNMGLSVLFFSKFYPSAKIIAFEPDTSVLPFLEKNIATQNLSNVTLHKKAVWIEETDLKFYTDQGMGGRVGNEYENQTPVIIKAIRLKEFLKEKIDFLKIDIEGAEFEVLKDCEENLKNVDNIFLEYHSDINEEQHLDTILQILKNNGFRYHLAESFSRKRPFIDNLLVCERFDLAINIFAYR